jgi:hypothetical protein
VLAATNIAMANATRCKRVITMGHKSDRNIYTSARSSRRRRRTARRSLTACSVTGPDGLRVFGPTHRHSCHTRASRRPGARVTPRRVTAPLQGFSGMSSCSMNVSGIRGASVRSGSGDLSSATFRRAAFLAGLLAER